MASKPWNRLASRFDTRGTWSIPREETTSIDSVLLRRTQLFHLWWYLLFSVSGWFVSFKTISIFGITCKTKYSGNISHTRQSVSSGSKHTEKWVKKKLDAAAFFTYFVLFRFLMKQCFEYLIKLLKRIIQHKENEGKKIAEIYAN